LRVPAVALDVILDCLDQVTNTAKCASALCFFFVKTLRRSFLAEHIPFPKQPRRPPTFLSPEEVTRVIESASNLFHRALLMTLYYTGMRRAETMWPPG